MSDAFTTSAGPYVLGALSPAERDAFERHLASCPACRSAVEHLAVLPGLMARVPLEALADGPGARARVGGPPAVLAADPGPPAALLDGLLQRVRRGRRRRRWWAAGAAALAACALVAAAMVALGGPRPGAGGPGGAGTVAAAPLRMRPLAPVPLSATVGLEPVAWGTRVHLACAYGVVAGDEAGDEPGAAGRSYALTVTDAAGRTQTIGTWTGRPGREAVLQAATSLPRDRIRVVEVRTQDGRPLLRLDTGTT